MMFIVIILILAIITGIWVFLFPNSKITIKANDIRKTSEFIYQKLQVWSNNRLQTHRLRQSLVQQEIMLAHSQQLPILSFNSEQHELAAKAFRRTIVFQWHRKTRIVIPTGTFVLSKFAIRELDNYLLDLLTSYYPRHHWQPIIIKRAPLINYFYIIINEK